MADWLDGIVVEESWRDQERCLLVVCPEPNEEAMQRRGDNRRDMRELLRDPEDVRKPFYRNLRQAVRAFHNLPSRCDQGEEQDHVELGRTIAFINLKKTGGGPSAVRDEVMEATKDAQANLVMQIRSIEPSHIAVAGRKAQEAFGRYMRQRVPLTVRTCGILHPSYAYFTCDEYYRRVQAQMASAFPHILRQKED